jgi:hypothetical protein
MRKEAKVGVSKELEQPRTAFGKGQETDSPQSLQKKRGSAPMLHFWPP